MKRKPNKDPAGRPYLDLSRSDFKKSPLRMAGYYSVMQERFFIAFGDRANFALSSVPSHLTVNVSEYALSFISAVSARMLLVLGRAEEISVKLQEEEEGVLLSISAEIEKSRALLKSLAINRQYFTLMAESCGFTWDLSLEEKHALVTIRLPAYTPDSYDVSEEPLSPSDDPFLLALSYPL